MMGLLYQAKLQINLCYGLERVQKQVTDFA